MTRAALLTTDFLAAIGTYVPLVDAYGEPGFISPVSGDETQGWVVGVANDTHADWTVGFSDDAIHVTDIEAGHNFASLYIGGVNGGNISAYIDDANGAHINLHAATGQTLPLLKLLDESGGPVLSVGPTVPASDPHIAGRVWQDSGVLMISAG